MFLTGLGCFHMGVPLLPGMASRKLQVLDFYKRYSARWGRSPSQGECAGELGISSKRVQQLLRQLERDGSITRVAGEHRNVRFPDPRDRVSIGDALLRLRAPELAAALGPELARIFGPPFPNSTLPVPPALDHIPDIEIGGLPDEGNER